MVIFSRIKLQELMADLLSVEIGRSGPYCNMALKGVAQRESVRFRAAAN